MTQRDSTWVPKFFFWFGLLVFSTLVVLLWPNRNYYLTPLALRPLNPLHSLFRPSGKSGLTFGMIGTVLMFLNLTYLIRKRLITIEWLGALRSWMAFHIFTGLLGGGLVLFHSAFYPRSALGILGFVSLCIVILTGLLGRYIYAHSPRSLEGKELDLDDIRKRLSHYKTQLATLGIPADFISSEQETTVDDRGTSLLQAFWGVIAGDRKTRMAYSEFEKNLTRTKNLSHQVRQVLPIAKQYYAERQWLNRYYEIRALMSRWRFLHGWFAIVVLVMALFHVLIAVQMGNLWFLPH